MTVNFTDFAQRHFLRQFEKRYARRQWEATVQSIFQDLSRLKMGDGNLMHSQQLDELWHQDEKWIFKYDFRVAQTHVSAKTSGNRCICLLDNASLKVEILLIYHKSDLPKNMGEQAFIKKVLDEEFPTLMSNFR